MKASVSRIIVMFFPILIFSLLWNGEDPLTHRQAFADEFDHDYFTANQNPEARQLLRENEAYHLNKGVLDDFNAKRYDIVIGEVKYILRRFPNHPQALMLLGSAAILKKEPSLAIPYYQRAISLYPQYAVTHAQFGSYLIDIDQMDMAIKRLNTAIKIDSKYAFAHGRLAEAYYKKGDIAHARQAAKQAKALGYKGEILSLILEE
jgi:tetratricopeptide (TPR) repeat protein